MCVCVCVFLIFVSRRIFLLDTYTHTHTHTARWEAYFTAAAEEERKEAERLYQWMMGEREKENLREKLHRFYHEKVDDETYVCGCVCVCMCIGWWTGWVGSYENVYMCMCYI